MNYSPWPIVNFCNNALKPLDFWGQVCHTSYMKNNETLSLEILALIDAFDAELDAARALDREDLAMARQARKDAAAEAALAYGNWH